MIFKPSPYQSAIFDWIRAGTGSCIVKAVAGSGKTTTVIQGVQFFPDLFTIQLVCFNTHIKEEMEARLKKLREDIGRPLANVRVNTFHSLGFAAIRRRIKPAQFDVKEHKLRKLMPEACGYNDVLVELYSAFCTKLVGYAKGAGIGVMFDDHNDAWQALIDHHGLYLDDKRATEEQAIEIARDLLHCSNEAALSPKRDDVGDQMRLTVDYNDMLYLPLLWKLSLHQNDALVIDEAQDTNPVRRELAKRSLHPGGRLMAVGDPKQSIYGFTGASIDAMDQIEETFDCIELPLTVSYRCGKSIVARAQKIVPYIEAFEGSPDGDVMSLPLRTAMNFLTPRDVILCRMTAPLIGLAFDFIRHGIGCRVLGRDIGANLISMIKKQDADTIVKLEKRLEEYRDEEVAKAMKKGREEKAAGIQDRVECVLTVIDELPAQERHVEALINRLENLFDDGDSGLLTLSTIHKAKGREWDNVAILEPDLMPCRWARQGWEHVQEENIQYVAWTRAKTALIDLEDTRIGRLRPRTASTPAAVPKPSDDFLETDFPAFLDRRQKPGAAA